MWLGVFSRWQRTNAKAMHFRVNFPSSAFIEHHTGDERDNIAVWQRVLGKHQTQTPQGITANATLPNMLWSFEHPKVNISQHYPTMLGGVAPTCCVLLHGALHPVHTIPFSNENDTVLFRFQKDSRPHLSFLYRFRPSTLQRASVLKTLLNLILYSFIFSIHSSSITFPATN